MKRIATAVALLATLGAACAKAGAEAPVPAAAAVGLSDDKAKAAMVEDGVFRLTAWHKPVNKSRVHDGAGWL